MEDWERALGVGERCPNCKIGVMQVVRPGKVRCSDECYITDWSVYLLSCSDGTFYCGCTNNIDKRIEAHNSGSGAKYTRSRTPVKLIAYTNFLNRSDALKLEYRVKQLPKDKKADFLETKIT